MLAISGQKRVRRRGSPTVSCTARCVRPELGSGGTERSPETRDLPEQMCGLSAAGSRSTIAAAGAAATGLRVRAGPACRPADAVTREGGVAAAALQVKRDAPAK